MVATEHHLAHMIRNRIKQYGDKLALKEVATIKNASANSYTWKAFGEKMDRAARALISLRIQPGDRVGIFSQNMPEWTIADFAILSVRGVSVPIYATHTTEYAQYIIEEAEISLVFVGEQEQFDRIAPLIGASSLKTVVLFDETIDRKSLPGVFTFSGFLDLGAESFSGQLEKRLSHSRKEDLATLIYTSGTTGNPKGVMLDHENFMYALQIHDRKLHVADSDISLAFLPLSHVFERTWTFYMLHRGVQNNYLRNPKEAVNALRLVKPTLMCTVPRLLEKIYEGIHAKIDKAPAIQKRLFHWAVGTGNKRMHKKRLQQPVNTIPGIQYFLAEKLILKRLQGIFGGRIRFMPCAGSPLLTEINEFFHSIGVNIKYGYGLTETTATVSAFDDSGFVFGSIGTVIKGIEVKTGNNNEILVKGPTIMKGYYKKPEETRKVFDGEWFKTGDAGTLDDNGNLYFNERIKELIKTSVGKYISPQLIESIISSDQFIDQIAVFGDNRKFVTALIVPSFESLEDYAKSKGIDFASMEELVNHTNVVQFFREKIEKLQQKLPGYEQVKRFKLLSHNFSMEKNEITPTLKLKRNVIEKRYKEEIDQMYL